MPQFNATIAHFTYHTHFISVFRVLSNSFFRCWARNEFLSSPDVCPHECACVCAQCTLNIHSTESQHLQMSPMTKIYKMHSIHGDVHSYGIVPTVSSEGLLNFYALQIDNNSSERTAKDKNKYSPLQNARIKRIDGTEQMKWKELNTMKKKLKNIRLIGTKHTEPATDRDSERERRIRIRNS